MNFSIYRYERPYAQAIQLKQGRFRYRKGLIISRMTSKGIQYSEVAPFPGLQSETPEDCQNQLRKIQAGLRVNLYPSVAWGLHQLDSPQCPPPVKSVPVNTLISGFKQDSAFYEQVHQRYAKGYRCFKIKVGLYTSQQEVHRIQTLLDTYSDITLRLDANKSWSYTQYEQFHRALKNPRLEYFEEPFRNPEEYAKLTAKQWKQIALDESLSLDMPHLLHSAQAFVLKPVVLGPERLAKLLALAQKQGKTIVFSSCFESSLGLSILAQYAAQYAPQTPCGLDTQQAFSEDIWTPAVEVTQGKIAFEQAFFGVQTQHQLKWKTRYIRKID